MGKVKPRLIGDTEVEEQQKKEQKAKSMEKKMMKKRDVVEKKEKKSVKVRKVSAKATTTRGKNYQEARKMIDRNKYYSLPEAIFLLKKEQQEPLMNLQKLKYQIYCKKLV